MPAPPLPFLAPEHHGRLVVMAMLAYSGAVEDGERAIAPFRALATADRRHGPADAVSRDLSRRTTEDYRPVAEFRNAVPGRHRSRHGRDDPRPARGRDRDDGGRAAPGARRRRGPRAGRRDRIRPPRAPRHGERRRDLRAPGRAAGARAVGRGPCGRAAPGRSPARTSASSATRERRASVPPTRHRPGTGSPRSRPATTRTTSSGSTRTSRRHSRATGGSRHPAAFEKTADRRAASVARIAPTKRGAST